MLELHHMQDECLQGQADFRSDGHYTNLVVTRESPLISISTSSE